MAFRNVCAKYIRNRSKNVSSRICVTYRRHVQFANVKATRFTTHRQPRNFIHRIIANTVYALRDCRNRITGVVCVLRYGIARVFARVIIKNNKTSRACKSRFFFFVPFAEPLSPFSTAKNRQTKRSNGNFKFHFFFYQIKPEWRNKTFAIGEAQLVEDCLGNLMFSFRKLRRRTVA